VRALAHAADEVAHVVGLAALAGVSLTPRPEARFGVEGLIPDVLREAAAAPSAVDLEMAFEALRQILKTIADALDADR
jgi:hypothetical protein